MEVYVGPTFTIDVSSPQAYAAGPPPSLFQLQDRGSDKGLVAFGSAASLSSQSSSSIGEPGDSDDEEGEEVSSNPSDKGLGPLGSLAELEESLPVKRGLSNHFSGKSKSFVNLSEASTATAKDLAKQENPLNKKRRVLIACKWSRKSKSSFYGWHDNPKSMPLFPLGEEDEQRQEPPSSPPSSSSERDEERPASRLSGGRTLHRTLSKLQGKRSFKSASCFALSDLHCYEEDDDDKINGSD